MTGHESQQQDNDMAGQRHDVIKTGKQYDMK